MNVMVENLDKGLGTDRQRKIAKILQNFTPASTARFRYHRHAKNIEILPIIPRRWSKEDPEFARIKDDLSTVDPKDRLSQRRIRRSIRTESGMKLK